MSDAPSNLTRAQLAQFLPDLRAIRVFEQLTKQANEVIPANVSDIKASLSETQIETSTALAAANQANDSLERIASALEALVTSPSRDNNAQKVDYIDFNQVAPHAVQTRRLVWSATDDTLDLHHSDGVTQQVGQELYGRILNNTGSAIANGIALGINPATNSFIPFIANGTLSPLNIVGVTTQAIPIGANGRITVWGRVHDLNTTGTPVGETWVAGDILYVSTTISGGFTRNKPTAPNLSIPIAQVITVDATAGVIAVRPSIEQQLYYGSFFKTTAQTPAAANTAYALTWDSTATASGISIGTPTSRIVIAKAGLYKFNLSVELSSTNATVKNVWVWFRKNGVDVADTSVVTSLDSGTAIRTPSRSIFFSLLANDYIEIMFASDNVNISISPIAATAFAPRTPSAILTVNQEQQ